MASKTYIVMKDGEEIEKLKTLTAAKELANAEGAEVYCGEKCVYRGIVKDDVSSAAVSSADDSAVAAIDDADSERAQASADGTDPAETPAPGEGTNPVEIVRAEKANERPRKLEYHKSPIHYRHYGNILEKFIKVLATYPEGKEKEQLVTLVANHMKRSMLQWNPTVASDKKVVADLRDMTDGAIVLTEAELAAKTASMKQQDKNTRSNNGGKKSKAKNRKK